MKKNYRDNTSNDILYKTEELLDAASNRKTWTFSTWFKRTGFSRSATLMAAYSGNSNAGYSILYFDGNNRLRFTGWSTAWLNTSATFTDSDWHHVTLTLDTTNPEAAERVRMFIDGVRVTQFYEYNMPAQDTELAINSAGPFEVGADPYIADNSSQTRFDGYLSETGLTDYAVKARQGKDGETIYQITNQTESKMPIPLALFKKDSLVHTMWMKGGEAVQNLRLENRFADRVVLNPDEDIVEINLNNNNLKVGSSGFRRKTKISFFEGLALFLI